MDAGKVDLDDVELAVAEAGAGKRPLLLVHGFTGAKEDFTVWLDRLADMGWHAVAPDLRGHGESGKPSSEDAYSFEIFADDIVRLVDALGWDRFTLLGHSMGGMVAQFVACKVPERLTGLVLMDTCDGPVDGLDASVVDAAVTIVRSEGIDALADVLVDTETPLDTPAHKRLVAEQPGYADFEDRKFRDSAPAMYAALAPLFTRTADRRHDLETLPATLPALVIVGEQDRPFLEPSRRMADTLPGAALAVIADAGHSPQFENPDAWWQALSGFLSRIAP
jgi:pimeloyl-ACP methyl ester carboxylesterase